MRAASVLTLIALAVLPAQAAYYVELTTGEKLTVQSYWRDGEDVHLMRGGIDIIVKESRIKRLEDGAPEPAMRTESATVAGSGGAAKASDEDVAEAILDGEAEAGEPEPQEKLSAYKERLGEMTPEELEAEDRRASKAMLSAQAARFEARYAKEKSPELVEQLDRQFKDLRARERAVDARRKELSPPQP